MNRAVHTYETKLFFFRASPPFNSTLSGGFCPYVVVPLLAERLRPYEGATTFHLSSSSEERLQSPKRQSFLIPERRKPIFDADKLLKRIEIPFYSFIGIKIASNRGYLVFLKEVKHQYFFQLTRLWRVYSKYNSNQKFVKEKIEKIYIFLTIFPLPSEQITP